MPAAKQKVTIDRMNQMFTVNKNSVSPPNIQIHPENSGPSPAKRKLKDRNLKSKSQISDPILNPPQSDPGSDHADSRKYKQEQTQIQIQIQITKPDRHANRRITSPAHPAGASARASQDLSLTDSPVQVPIRVLMGTRGSPLFGGSMFASAALSLLDSWDLGHCAGWRIG